MLEREAARVTVSTSGPQRPVLVCFPKVPRGPKGMRDPV